MLIRLAVFSIVLGLPLVASAQLLSVSGRVLTDAGAPVQGASVSFQRIDPVGPAAQSATTGADGRFSQTGFANNVTWRATPTRAGFTMTPAFRDFQTAFGRPAAVLAFTASPIQIRPPAPPTTFTVSGRVARADGRGAPGVQVRVIQVASPATPARVAVTDVDGRWRLSDLRIGTDYEARPVRFAADRFTPASARFDGPPTDLRGNIIGIQSAVNFGITSPLFAASGRVATTTRGTGLEGATVHFLREDGGPVPAAVATNARGEWTQQGLELGVRYVVVPELGEYDFVPVERVLYANAGGPRFGLDFLVPDTFAVDGRVADATGRPFAGVAIGAHVIGDDGSLRCATTNAVGGYRIAGLESGREYLVQAYYFDGRAYAFTPASPRTDGPATLDFEIRPDPLVVASYRPGPNCPF